MAGQEIFRSQIETGVAVSEYLWYITGSPNTDRITSNRRNLREQVIKAGSFHKKFLLTGATGFVGACLLRRLVGEGARPHILIRKDARLWRIKDLLPRIHVHTVDLTDGAGLRKVVGRIRPDIIYHLAANGAYSSQHDADRIVTTNILGGWNLLQACAFGKYELFVNTGTSSEYGFKTKPMRESDALEPVSYYAVTKCTMTWLGMQAAREGRPVVTLRPFSVYGPYEEPTRLIPVLMAALYHQKPMDLVPAATARDFIYVDDMVDAFLKINMLTKARGRVLNIGTGRQTTLRQLIAAAQKATGRTTDFRWGKMPAKSWDTSRWVADMSRTKEILGWSPKTDLLSGLKKTWQWYQVHHDIYQGSGKLAE